MSTARIWLACTLAIAMASLVVLPGYAEPWEQGPHGERHGEYHRLRAEMEDLGQRIEAEREQLVRDEQRMADLRRRMDELREEREEQRGGWQRY